MEVALGSKAITLSLAKATSGNSHSLPSSLAFNPKIKISVKLRNTHEGKNLSVSATARFGSLKGGAGLLERPSFDQTQFYPSTQVQEGGDIGSVKERRGCSSGDSYKVLLIDDVRHTEQLVAKVIPQAVPSITPDNARKLFSESREQGVAVVIVAVKEHAEFYAQMMVRGGLRSMIEPDSTMA
ncbi:ATP-dependent Clp protease adapter protein CLPS2, chloroplastic-like [Aristolochia californica]|uniref:ATP-dependent Clp protease adapter protein CLPS2, chloroplastic-like n=1 Tax=Aristolochia californica TaxID=171875 RepID=UPI0035E2C800